MATKRGGSSEQVCGGSERKRISRHRLLVIKENGKCQFLEMTWWTSAKSQKKNIRRRRNPKPSTFFPKCYKYCDKEFVDIDDK